MTRFPVILADPPWLFSDTGTRLAPSHRGTGRASASAHYQVMPTEAICAAGAWVQQLAAADAFLFLWAPNALVLDGTATEVARAWDFEPRQLIPWVKVDAAGYPRIGGGHFTRVCTEQLILCRRGKANVRRRDVPGVIVAERGRHSAKPYESYRLIERLCDGPFVELYARRRFSEKWTAWGNEAPAPRMDDRG
jgi:N6-adenosine-specific RNA methylase IME4